ncbi:MAG: CRP-like cAMP-binding protein [Candidatus Poriferisodalaceae bacterium]|jgi:CRP-like cAMP-binding protein
MASCKAAETRTHQTGTNMSDNKLDALKATTIFSSCTKDQLELIGRVTEQAQLSAGTTIVKEDSLPHQMVILISGKAVVTTGDTQLAELGAGDVIGELAMVDDARASATVTLTEDSEVWLIARAGFKPVWEENPEISKALLTAVVGRLRSTNALLH